MELNSVAQPDLSPSKEKEVHERRPDMQAEGKLHRVVQVKARTMNNVL